MRFDRSGQLPNISRLIDAAALSKHINGILSTERIVELAEAGFIPRYEIDGRILFLPGEAKAWITKTLVKKHESRAIPAAITVMNLTADFVPTEAPPSLRQFRGHLIEIPVRSIQCPPGSGVYFLCRDGEVVYVGQSENVRKRVGEHAGRKDFDSAFFLHVPASDLLFAEVEFIRALQPPLNADGWGRLANRREGEPLSARTLLAMGINPEQTGVFSGILEGCGATETA